VKAETFYILQIDKNLLSPYDPCPTPRTFNALRNASPTSKTKSARLLKKKMAKHTSKKINGREMVAVGALPESLKMEMFLKKVA